MSDPLNIDFKWLDRAQSSLFDRAFAAEIGIALGSQWMTELQDLYSRTTRTHVNACAHTLALWLGANWWRLRWEPEPRNAREDIDWRIAHSVASAGGGFVWPNIIFASDGESLAVASIVRLKPEPFEPLRYINPANGRITAAEFESKIDAFMEAMVSRHHDMEIEDPTLPVLWAEVKEERDDPAAARWRKLEALCGYDPDEAPVAIIETLAEDTSKLGRHALEEVAAHGRHQTSEVLASILEIAKIKGQPRAGAFRCKPQMLKKKPHYKAGQRPWERAALLAHAARKEWGLGTEPISNMTLADVLQTKAAAFKDHSIKASTPMPLAIRHSDEEKTDVYIGSSWRTTRRFNASRLLGHWLDATGEADRLVPAAEAKTADQQFQRAFAQEFLCPFDALMERLQTEYPAGDATEEAADYFGVSSQVVRTTLVNKRELDREALNWAT